MHRAENNKEQNDQKELTAFMETFIVDSRGVPQNYIYRYGFAFLREIMAGDWFTKYGKAKKQ